VDTLEVVGCESLGVRGLSCAVYASPNQLVVIDPGVALGYTRRKLHPHPLQAVAGSIARSRLVKLWSRASCIVFTHMHGDHVPLPNPNPFQLGIEHLPRAGHRILVASLTSIEFERMCRRLRALLQTFPSTVLVPRAARLDAVEVYGPFRHGIVDSPVHAVLVLGSRSVLHLSDTELLVEEVVDLVRLLRPDIVVTGGPPIYRYVHDPELVRAMLARASRVLTEIARLSDVVIVDHHVLRSIEGLRWVEEMRRLLSNVTTGAEYCGRRPLPLEAWREILYEVYPVEREWFRHSYRRYVEAFYPLYQALVERIERVYVLSENEARD